MENPDFAAAIFGKVAWRLLPFLGLCYLTAFFDRKMSAWRCSRWPLRKSCSVSGPTLHRSVSWFQIGNGRKDSECFIAAEPRVGERSRT